jgi:hypothetical protein
VGVQDWEAVAAVSVGREELVSFVFEVEMCFVERKDPNFGNQNCDMEMVVQAFMACACRSLASTSIDSGLEG